MASVPVSLEGRLVSRVSRDKGGARHRFVTEVAPQSELPHDPPHNELRNPALERLPGTYLARDGFALHRKGLISLNPHVVAKAQQMSAPRSWANVARTALQGYDLDYFTPLKVEDEFVADFPDEALAATDPFWYECLVGYFIGKKLPFQLVETALKHAWGSKLSEVKADDRGFFFLRISDAEFRRYLLDRGPMTVARVPLILKQWDPLLELKKDDHTKVPVWIRLRNIPMVLWLVQGIGGIASLIGRPLYVDQNTAHMKLLSYARVCVEITANDIRQDSVKVRMKGTTRVVDVEYEWRPISCPRCGTFGHKCSMTKNSPIQT
ncbi:hypothetical protein BT93_G0122 [Corymbia citriodora subsp. variegata]|nr:hypothetical protein BT93_G0122 [Corymbia citriodora subsp. variegata]